uniref:Uncharacterized protein n=1 Tax=Arundo donax TaxID=35708 RepID=A0A0A9ACX5_ARUDO
MLIRGMRPEQGKVRCREIECFGWKDVKEICGGAEGRSPKGGRYARLEQQGANDIISGANDVFGSTVLG